MKLVVCLYQALSGASELFCKCGSLGPVLCPYFLVYIGDRTAEHASGVCGAVSHWQSIVSDRPWWYRWARNRQWPVRSRKMVICWWRCRCCTWSSGGGQCRVRWGLCWVRWRAVLVRVESYARSGGGLCWFGWRAMLGQVEGCAGSGRGLCWVRWRDVLVRVESCAGSGGGMCWVRWRAVPGQVRAVLGQVEGCAGSGGELC